MSSLRIRVPATHARRSEIQSDDFNERSTATTLTSIRRSVRDSGENLRSGCTDLPFLEQYFVCRATSFF